MRRTSFLPIFRSLLGGTLLAVLATGCNNEDFDSTSTDEKDAVVISAGAALSADDETETRAADVTWGVNDHIGITMLSPATNGVVNNYTNRDYVTATGDGTFASADGDNKMFYPTDGSDVTFKAYYPYTGLTGYPNYPLDVSGQATIAGLDLMTAIHQNQDNSVVNSKNKPSAHLVFHHRLTMVGVNLYAETGKGVDIDLTGCELVIKGMKTTGNYNLATDVLSVDATSVQDIVIPLSPSHTGRAILLPREAGQGVTFQVTTANGGVYSAVMDEALDLKGGSKYTFNLTLKATPSLITASIEEWTEGPVKEYDIVNLITGTGTNDGFSKDAELKLYAKDANASEYSESGTFTFDGTKWEKSGSPLYWENFTGPKVDFKATSLYAQALNTSQVPDIVLGKAPEVALYKGIHFEMKHIGAKVTVKLNSSDGIYTAEDLQNAVVTFPGYIKSYLFDAIAVTFAPDATDKGDITPEKQGTGKPQERVAIFPPQDISAGNTLAKVTIGGHTYEVKDAFSFKAGEHHVISLNIGKSGVAMTVKLVDWVKGGEYDEVVRIGTPKLGTNEGIPDGSQLYLFTEEVQGGNRSDVPGYFTYNATANSWNYSDAANSLYWENMPNTGRIFASIVRDAVNSTEGYNQSKDYIVATPVENNGGTGNTALHFDMKHAVSQVRVVLRASDIYTPEQLKNAMVSLPGYAIGGLLDKGVFFPGTGSGDIKLDFPDNADISSHAYLQAQAIPAGQTVARVVVDPDGAGSLPPRTYDVKYDQEVLYNAGEITHLYITINGSELQMSVKVTGWADQTPVELKYAFDQTDSKVENFETDDLIRFYNLGSGTTVLDNKDYTVKKDGEKFILRPQGTPWFRDDFKNGDKIVAVFPAPDVVPSVDEGKNTFDWDMATKFDPTVRDNDILVANNGVIKDKSANVNLTFNHIMSKVTVNIIKGNGFTDNEIKNGNPSVKLVDFKQQGKVDITTGNVSDLEGKGSFVPVSINPQQDVDAVLSYQALVLPQKKESNPVLVSVTLNGITYDAKWTGTFDFDAGKNHVLNITLEKTGLKISASIAGWVDGSSGSIIIK